MRKGLLLKYISGEATDTEREQVLDWVDKSPDNKEYFIILKNTWVSQNIPDSKASLSELGNLRRSINRTGDNPLVSAAKLSKEKIFRIIACLSTAVAAVAIGILVTKPSVASIEQIYKNELIAISMNDYPEEFKRIIYTEKGVKSLIVLPDSSKVWLNSDTRIVFPEKFIGATREVELEGEAYFSVVSDPLKPMIVSTKKGFKVKVMGTEFNLRSYNNEDKAVASLYSGKIDLLYKDSEETEIVKRIQPNEQVVIAQNVVKIAQPKAIADNSAWKEGRLIFDSAKMDAVIKELERWHGIQIIVEDPKILSYTISATFNSESIIQIMDMIKYCILADYRFESNKVYIFSR